MFLVKALDRFVAPPRVKSHEQICGFAVVRLRDADAMSELLENVGPTNCGDPVSVG